MILLCVQGVILLMQFSILGYAVEHGFSLFHLGWISLMCVGTFVNFLWAGKRWLTQIQEK